MKMETGYVFNRYITLLVYVFSLNQLITCAPFGSLGSLAGGSTGDSVGKSGGSVASSVTNKNISPGIFNLNFQDVFKPFDSSLESMKKVRGDLIKCKLVRHELFAHYMIYYGQIMGVDLYYELHGSTDEAYVDLYNADPSNIKVHECRNEGQGKHGQSIFDKLYIGLKNLDHNGNVQKRRVRYSDGSCNCQAYAMYAWADMKPSPECDYNKMNI